MMKTRFMRFMIGSVALISACFLFVSSDYADEVAPVAKVVWVKGAFHATSATLQSRSLQAGFPIYLHDTLITDAQTQAQIVFTDNTLMTFRPGSNFYVDQYAYQPKTAKSQAVGTYVMRLVAGGFRTITGLIAQNQPSHYQVNTPVAVIGVRGTDYEVDFSDGQLFIRYYHGSPCVTSAGEALCLTPKTPYARAPGHHLPPVPLTQRPAQFAQPLSITQTTYAIVPLVSAGVPPTPPGGGGVTTTPPAQSPGSPGGNAASPSPPPPPLPSPPVGAAPPAPGGAPSSTTVGTPSPVLPVEAPAPVPAAPASGATGLQPALSMPPPVPGTVTPSVPPTVGAEDVGAVVGPAAAGEAGAPPPELEVPSSPPAPPPSTGTNQQTPADQNGLLNSFCIQPR
jgi:hypothetical protein